MTSDSPSPRRVTITTLAAELGVSPTTVSNAFNRPDQLSQRLRQRILDHANKRGYTGPNPTALSLRSRRAGAIGVLLTEELTYAFEDQASVDFMAGVAQECATMGWSLLLLPAGVTNSAPDADPSAAAHALVGRAAVDGFIVYSVAADDPYLDAVRRRQLPVVVCDQPRPRNPCSQDRDAELEHYVGIDDFEGIQPAVQQLLAAGHAPDSIGALCIRLDRSPAEGFVSAQRLASAHMDVQRRRVEGIAAVLGTGDFPLVETYVNDPVSSYEAARTLLSAHPELTAVVCTTDSLALAVLAYARDTNRRVPEDLSVTGFDGIARALAAGVTTVTQPSRDKGRAACAHLARMVAGVSAPAPAPCQILPTHFTPGRTVAPPRG